MARISNKNERFRTKDEICRDVAFVISCDSLHRGTKLAVVDQVLWVWTEFEGKYEGCEFWSEAALELGFKSAGLVHEHLIPRKIVRKMLFDLSAPTITEVRKILDAYCIGVVVTKEEDLRLNSIGLRSKMPEDWDGANLWARYREADIRVTRKKRRTEQAETQQPLSAALFTCSTVIPTSTP